MLERRFLKTSIPVGIRVSTCKSDRGNTYDYYDFFVTVDGINLYFSIDGGAQSLLINYAKAVDKNEHREAV